MNWNAHRTYASPYQEARQLAVSGRLKVRWSDWLGQHPRALSAGTPLADKVEGMLLGLAIGDSLGNTSESNNPAQRRARHGWIEGYLPNRHAGGAHAGLPSDDSQLAYRTLQHLVEHGRLEPQFLGLRLANGPIYGIGQATREWLQRFKGGVPWHSAGSPSAGNGALMRIAPVLIPHLSRPNCDLWADTLLAAHLTHDDELSNVSCVAMVDALWRAIDTRGPVPAGWWIGRWLEVCDAIGTGVSYRARGNHPPGFEGTISDLLRGHVVPALERRLPVDDAGDIWHSGAYLLETVPTVLYVLERFGNDPREALLQAVNQTRDNDTIAAIVGAAVGALHGASALPKGWIDGLSGRTAGHDDHRMFQLIARSGEMFGYGCSPMVAERARLWQPDRGKPGAPVIPTDLHDGPMWVKVVSFLQQNWAVVRRHGPGTVTRIWFIDDALEVFDYLDFPDAASAHAALAANGFQTYDRRRDRYLDSSVPDAKRGAFSWSARRIYSSGEYWLMT